MMIKFPYLIYIKNIQDFSKKKQRELNIPEYFIYELSIEGKKDSGIVFPYLTLPMRRHVFKASISPADHAVEISRNLKQDKNNYKMD